jgi:hypothetical protein
MLSAGIASCTAENAPVGDDLATATYSGDQAFSASAAYIQQTVSPVRTTISLESVNNPAPVGQVVRYVATVSQVPSGGTVVFRSGSTAISGCGAIHPSALHGIARCCTTYPDAGSVNVRAVSSGAVQFSSSTSKTLTEAIGRTDAAMPLHH